MKKIVMCLLMLLLVACNKQVIPIDLSSVERVNITSSSDDTDITFNMDNPNWGKYMKSISSLAYEEVSNEELGFLNEDTDDAIIHLDEVKYRYFLKCEDDNGHSEFVVMGNKVAYIYKTGEDFKYYLAQDTDPAYYSEITDQIKSLFEVKMKKPVIYLYPEKPSDVTVELITDLELTSTYPKYEGDWEIEAHPSGMLTDKTGKSYPYLYWEGIGHIRPDFDEGFVVKGEKTIDFLEEKLTHIGLNYQERTDFITYWIADLESNPYNKIHFMFESYEDLVELKVNPLPDTSIRFFMIFEGLEEDEQIKEQVLPSFERKGFTLIEWGGGQL